MIPSTSCGRYIKQLNDLLRKNANNQLRSQDLTVSQINVLMLLRDLPDRQATFKEMERILRVAQATTAGLMSRLEQKSFVETYTDPEDKRVKIVKLTPEGEKVCDQGAANMEAAENRLLSGFTEQEKDDFLRMLIKAGENMK